MSKPDLKGDADLLGKALRKAYEDPRAKAARQKKEVPEPIKKPPGK